MDISPNPGPDRSKDCMHVLYLNARSLKALPPLAGDDTPRTKICKITILQQLVHSGDFDIVCICETCLTQTVFDHEILPDYSIFRRDRGDRIGGGVLVAVKADIRASEDRGRKDIETMFLELKSDHGKPVFLDCFYHPGISPEPLIELNSSLLETSEKSCNIVVGDFNLP